MGIPVAISITADAAILISHLVILSINKIQISIKLFFVDFHNLIIEENNDCYKIYKEITINPLKNLSKTI